MLKKISNKKQFYVFKVKRFSWKKTHETNIYVKTTKYNQY